MAEWTRSTARLTALADEALADTGCERRMLVAGPAYLVKGHVFLLVRRGTMWLRLSPHDAGTLEPACRDLADPPPSGFVELPDDLVDDGTLLREWLLRAHAHARSLPVKR